MPELSIGCSGFSYKHWKNAFYPADLPERRWLEYYSGIFPTVELNVTFYRLPSPSAFRSWQQGTPPGFIFAVKGSRFITHVKRLLDPEEPLARFFEGAFLLKEKLAVVLWQFPPAFKLDLDRFSAFLALLANYPCRHAFEFRHESWIVRPVIDLCRRNNAGLCMADSPPHLDELPVTADFVYLRRHGLQARYAGRYSKAQIARDADRIRKYQSEGKDIFIYFNNDAHGYAPQNARELSEMLG